MMLAASDRRHRLRLRRACTSRTPAPIRSRRSSTSAQPPGYPDDHPFVPHGFAVIVTAPAAFRFTYEADPAKHRRAAELLAGEPVPDADEDTLPRLLTELMRDVGAPARPRELGYEEDDVDDLVDGALKQQRLLSIAPREVGPRRARRDLPRLDGELVRRLPWPRGRITSERTLNTASLRSKRANGRSMPSKRPSPR